jgi:hypothetical protein
MSENEKSILEWSIERLRFRFDNIDDYEDWKKERRVFFHFSPSSSDDRGESLFVDPEKSSDDFEISPENGEVKIDLEEAGPVITVRVFVEVALRPGVDDEAIASWAREKGGWFGSTIHLGLYDVQTTHDEGGDWELVG